MAATSPSLGGIGRFTAGSFSAEQTDNELELLELQLTATQPKPHHVVAPGRFSNRDRNHFATHPRRRKAQKSLMTIWSERCLLDEMQVEQTKKMLSQILRWDFNAFTLDRLTDGHYLPTLCTHLIHEQGIIRHFNLDILTVWKFFYLVEQGYHNVNPYHNGVHAADVTQAMHCFLQEELFREHLTPLEFLAAIISAICHDLDHPGKNEKFLIATSSHLAGLYNNLSVLENHHWRSTLSILWESGLAGQFQPEVRQQLQTKIKDMILATDISRQQEFLGRLKQYMSQGDLNMSITEHRQFLLQIAMKCADISNPCRPWNLSRLWSYRACEEFYRQGDREMELGLTVTPFCDRFHMSVAKVQAGFYRFVAAPLFDEWNQLLASPLSNTMVHNLATNQARWDLIVQQEARNLMVESAASQSSSTSSSYSSGRHSSQGSRRESLEPPNANSNQPPQHHRHHSKSSADGDEDSDPCISFPYLPLEQPMDYPGRSEETPFIRRHSLPIPGNRSKLHPSSRTSSEESSEDLPAQNLHRQYSLVDRRRFVRQSETGIYPNYRLNNKRKVFAASRSPIESVSCEEQSSNSLDIENTPRVTFHLGNEEKEEEEDENKENKGNLKRRGSAPSSLLIDQFSFGLAPSNPSSRDSSPLLRTKILNGTFLNSQHRRGSLPAQLVSCSEFEQLGRLRRHQRQHCLPQCTNMKRSASCGRDSHVNPSEHPKTKLKSRKTTTLKSKGVAGPESLNPYLHSSAFACQKRLGFARRGSAPMGAMLDSHSVHIDPSILNCGYKRRTDLFKELQSISKNKILTENSVVSSSFDTELLQDVQTSLAVMNVRRGSLPVELIGLPIVQ